MKKPSLGRRIKRTLKDTGYGLLASGLLSMPLQANPHPNPSTTKASKGVVEGDSYIISPGEPNPDFNGSGKVDFLDFVGFAQAFGSRRTDLDWDARYDLNEDEQVGFFDFLKLTETFGKDIEIRENPPQITEIPLQKIPQVEPFTEPRTLDLFQFITEPDSNLVYEIVGSNGLVTQLKDSILAYRPRGLFNKEDNGLAKVAFRVRKGDLESNLGELEVEIESDNDFIDEYKTLFPDIQEGLKSPIKMAYLWAGATRLDVKNKDPRTWEGPLTSEEDLANAENAIKQLHILTSGFIPKDIEIVRGTDHTKIYNEATNTVEPPEGWIHWYTRDNIRGNGGAYNNGDRNRNYTAAGYYTKPGANFSTHLHENYHVATSGTHSEKVGDLFSVGGIPDVKAYSPMHIALVTANIDERLKAGLAKAEP